MENDKQIVVSHGTVHADGRVETVGEIVAEKDHEVVPVPANAQAATKASVVPSEAETAEADRVAKEKDEPVEDADADPELVDHSDHIPDYSYHNHE